MTKILHTDLTHSTKYSAGADVYSSESTHLGSVYNWSTTTVMIPTGVYLGEMPENTYLQLSLRSSLGVCGVYMPHGVGVIDKDYPGEIKVIASFTEQAIYELLKRKIAIQTRQGEYILPEQTKIAQLVMLGYIPFGKNSGTNRTGGFGSTNSFREWQQDIDTDLEYIKYMQDTMRD